MEHYRLVEFDRFAVASYNAVHGTKFEPMDICKIHAQDLDIVETDKYFYIVCYSFPCQDLSLAGHQRGMSKGSGTRSGLLWEVERILKECADSFEYELPNLLLMENVPQVHGKKNKEDFEAWQQVLHSLGYTSVWADLNAKDFGVPQNRNRCFMVSWLGEHSYQFPKPFELKKRLRDVLEETVDEKYYLSDELVQKLLTENDESFLHPSQ